MLNHNSDDKSPEIAPELFTAYALGQLAGDEHAAIEAALAAGTEDSLRAVREAKSLAESILAARGTEALPDASSQLRELVAQRSLETEPKQPAFGQVEPAPARKPWRRRILIGATIAAALMLLCAILIPHFQVARELARRSVALSDITTRFSAVNGQTPTDTAVEGVTWEEAQRNTKQAHSLTTEFLAEGRDLKEWERAPTELAGAKGAAPVVPPAPSADYQRFMTRNPRAPAPDPKGYDEVVDAYTAPAPGTSAQLPELRSEVKSRGGDAVPLASSSGGSSDSKALKQQALGDVSPRIVISEEEVTQEVQRLAEAKGLAKGTYVDSDQSLGVKTRYYREARTPASKAADFAAAQAQAESTTELEVAQKAAEVSRAELAGFEKLMELRKKNEGAVSESELRKYAIQFEVARAKVEALRKTLRERAEGSGTEQYEPIFENAFLNPRSEPLSTFSIDVDTASYANVRRFLNEGRLPPPSAVRIEELVNYFRYDYPQPKGQEPFSVNMEVAECPWREGHWLLRVGLKGNEVNVDRRPASNLVFLLDVSGSMADANKLPLLKTAMQMLVRELGENDRVSIVTYAGEAGLKLASTGAHEQTKILAAIESLSSGGSTNGSAGIELAYEQASQHFIKGGTNRVILCTDGDLNVGVTSDDALVKLIKEKAKGGTFLTVLGFGVGNLKDAKMEKLADNGNGLFAYIDSVREARKVLVEQLAGSTITIAKDVKIQIEFNPAQIASYRLLGYENRVMAAADFNNDKRDAGEIGAGHTVTALYELVPVGAATEATKPQQGTEPLKYQASGAESKVEGRKSNVEEDTPLTKAAASGELLTLKLRYKEPEGETSKLIEVALKERAHSFQSASPDVQFAVAVASFGMILRNSEHRGSGNLAAVQEIAATAIGKDPGGYRAEFLDLVRKAQELK